MPSTDSTEPTVLATPADLRGQAGALASRLREIAPGKTLQTQAYFWTERFTYDAKGNRMAVQNGWGITRYAYNAADRITQAGNRAYQHDADGNLTRETLGAREIRYRYDGEDRMIEAAGSLLGWTDQGPQPEAISYTYDALGRRLSREQDFRQGFRSGTIDTWYLYQGRSMIVAAELREVKLPAGFLPPGHEGSGGPPGQTGRPGGGPSAGVPGNPGGPGNPGNPGGSPPATPPPFQAPDEHSAREYVLAGSMIISHTDLVTSPVHRQQTSWYHTDVRGSTMMLTGEHAEPKAAYYYDAYGMVYGEHPPQGIPRPAVPQVARPAVERGTEYLYTGKRFDPETGLADYGFRDYAASLARFTTMDPVRDGRNWFAYVEGDPVNRVDPLGLRPASDNPRDRESIVFFRQELPNSIELFGVNIRTSSLIGVSEIVTGTTLVVGSAIAAVASGGSASVPAAQGGILGIQLIGLGIATLSSGEVFDPLNVFLPPEAGLIDSFAPEEN